MRFLVFSLLLVCGGWAVVVGGQGLSTGLGRFVLPPEKQQLLANDALDGSKDAATTLAKNYLMAPSDGNSALYWAQIGAENGDDQSQYIYGSLLGYGKNHTAQEKRRAVFWLRASARQGNKNAMIMLKEVDKDGTAVGGKWNGMK